MEDFSHDLSLMKSELHERDIEEGIIYSGIGLVENQSLMKSDLHEGDIEEGILYPGIGLVENQLRWGFILKVYGIVAAQLFLTTIVSTIMFFCPPITKFLIEKPFFQYLFVSLPVVLIIPLFLYRKRHPLNLAILAVYTICWSISVGFFCAVTDGKIVLQALFLTASVVTSLTAMAFSGSKMGFEFSFLRPMLFASLFTLVLACFIQIYFPLGSAINMILGVLGASTFSIYLVYHTEDLIRRYKYDEYIIASAAIYLDIIMIFLKILQILRPCDNYS